LTAALSFQDLHLSYGGKPALRGVSLTIAPGEIVALLGPSGCGKSTLLRLAAGLERPAAGRIAMAGRPLAGEGIFVAPEERGIGLMFEDYALFPHLDVAANIGFGLYGRRKAEAAGIVADLLARIGLADRARAYPHMLSGGEQQRVALARALAPSPAVLLMDEPFSNLDQRLRRGMRAETTGLLKSAGAAALMVTHDPDDALAVADRIALMRDGRIVQVETPIEVWNRPADRWVAAFFADLLEIPAIIRSERAETPLGSFAAPDRPDGPALVCIRRDAFDLASPNPELAGRVETSRFIGEYLILCVRIEGQEQPVEIHAPADHSVEIGARVGIAIDRARAHVFST
jgi:iron(III) transport system ATP-binding protein